MYLKSFDYVAPKSMEELLQVLKENPDARPIAGGQSLLPMLKLRIFDPGLLVDLMYIKELQQISLVGADEIHIGAMVKHSRVINAPEIRENVPILSSTAEHIADIQIRNRGTIGGSVCEADPSADYLPTLFVLDASVELQSLNGIRTVPIRQFIVGPLTTAIDEGEILTKVIVKRNTNNFAVEKYARRQADFAVASVTAICDVQSDGLIKDIRVAVGAQRNGPVRLEKLERAVVGKNRDNIDISEIAQSARDELDPLSDLHGSAEYRKDVTVNMLKRVLSQLILEGGRD